MVVPDQLLGLRVDVIGGRPEGVLDPSIVDLQFDSGELVCRSGRAPEFGDLAGGATLTFTQVIRGDVIPAVYPPSVQAVSVRVDC